jgi:hypothetical protein
MARSKRAFVDGDYVILHSHWHGLSDSPRGEAVVDIYRSENGKVVEHWDVIQPIPETAANNKRCFDPLTITVAAILRVQPPKQGDTMSKATSFEADIRPLFTQRDIQGMSKAFNLASYDEVKAHAAAIFDRIRGIGGAVMPPPPPKGEGPWAQSRIELFAKWVADGCPP